MNNEQLIHQNFETLHEYLFNALEKGDYYVANKLASFCELHLSNNDSDNPLVSQFYAISMVYYFIFLYYYYYCYSLTYYYYYRYYVLFMMIIWMLECYGKEHLYN